MIPVGSLLTIVAFATAALAEPDRPGANERADASTALGQEVAQAVAEARTAIARGEHERAVQLLADAAEVTHALYVGAPAAELVAQLDALADDLRAPPRSEEERRSGAAAARRAGEPVFARLAERSRSLDPEVVASASDAERRLARGDRRGAAESLSRARERLVADAGLGPIEDAYARIVAAGAELGEGDAATARRLLTGVPAVLERVRLASPLVPARFDLRAAAIAAQRGEWDVAQDLLDSAADRLESIMNGADPDLAFDVRPIAMQARALVHAVASGNTPSAREIRSLAERTREVGAS